MDVVRARRLARNTGRTRIDPGDFFGFQGGLNLVDPPLKLKPGQLLAAKNYEPGIRGGYRSIAGFERFDGRTAPSEAAYWLLNYDGATSVPSLAATVAGETSAATGVLLALVQTQAVTVVNEALRSEEFDNAAWVKTNVTPTANFIANPVNAAVTAERMLETAANAEHSWEQVITKTAAAAQTAWFPIYVRADGRVRGRITVFEGANSVRSDFNLTLGSIDAFVQAGTFTGLDETLEALPGGWFRVALKVTTNAAATVIIRINLLDATGTLSYTGDTGLGMDVFGGQYTQNTGALPPAYVPTNAQARGNGFGWLVLARVAGTFADNEDLEVAAADFAMANGLAAINGATTDALHAAYKALAVADARALITTVPGAGRILGVAVYNGIGYAWRNNAGGTAAVMHKSSAAGWVAVNLGFKLRFDAGLAAGIVEGNTVTGFTSGASGVVRRVVVLTGTFAGNNATGYLIIPTISGGPFQDNEALQVSGTTRATADGASAAQTLLPNGVCEFRINNFYGHTATKRLYGVDGVNRGFEYQDSPEFFVLIETGMTVDTPNHIGVHQEQLFFAFPGGSLQKSGVLDPILWTISTGAAELAVGDEITGLLEEVSQTLFIFTRNKTKFLAGTVAGYTLDNFNAETGAYPFTVGRIGQGLYLDDRGLTSLATTDRFGNYKSNSFSELIDPLLKAIRLLSTTNVVSKNNNLYRLYFNDGRFLSVGVRGNQISGITVCDYGKVVRCIFSGEETDGEEMMLFGSDDGFVYRADKGTSFDGLVIQSFLRPTFHFSRAPGRVKRYRRAAFDVTTTGPCTLAITTDYSFADPNVPGDPIANIVLAGGGGFWDISNWDQFKWNTGVVATAAVKLEGSGINIGFLLASESAVNEPHSIEGVTMHTSYRRLNRGLGNG